MQPHNNGGNMNQELNNEIRRIVKNFNQKRNRAIKRGFSYVPDQVYVSDIKKNYQTAKEIKKYLKELEKFNTLKDTALEVVETLGGGRTSRYKMMVIKDNLEKTKDFFDRQIAEAKELFYENQFSIARRDYLYNLEEKRKDLELDINTLNQAQLNSFERYTEQYLNENKSKINAYKGFLSELEDIMKMAGVSDTQRRKLYDKMSDLTPAQFVKMYRKSDLINRIYDLVISPSHGEKRLITDDEDARRLVDAFIETFDELKASVVTL